MTTTAPLLPAAEVHRAAMLRELGFPVRGSAAFHSEGQKGDALHVATRKAVAAGVVSGVEKFVPGPGVKAKGMSAEGRALLAELRALAPAR